MKFCSTNCFRLQSLPCVRLLQKDRFCVFRSLKLSQHFRVVGSQDVWDKPFFGERCTPWPWGFIVAWVVAWVVARVIINVVCLDVVDVCFNAVIVAGLVASDFLDRAESAETLEEHGADPDDAVEDDEKQRDANQWWEHWQILGAPHH